MPVGRRKDQAATDAETVARVRGALEGHWRQGAEAVPVAYVLDLLNPRGLWSHDPERKRAREAPVQPAEIPDGRDPLTGCRPASAPPRA